MRHQASHLIVLAALLCPDVQLLLLSLTWSRNHDLLSATSLMLMMSLMTGSFPKRIIMDGIPACVVLGCHRLLQVSGQQRILACVVLGYEATCCFYQTNTASQSPTV